VVTLALPMNESCNLFGVGAVGVFVVVSVSLNSIREVQACFLPHFLLSLHFGVCFLQSLFMRFLIIWEFFL
jgi:hypothetical protein